MIRWSSFAILAALLAATAPGICADVTWTRGNNTDLWADAANWTSNPALPGTTDNVIFDSTGSGALVSLGATARTVGSITFNRSGGFMVTGGSAALSLSGGITTLTADTYYMTPYSSASNSAGVRLTGSQTISVYAGGSLYMKGVAVSSPSNAPYTINKTGGGTLFGGYGGNSYVNWGIVNVMEGTFVLGNESTTGSTGNPTVSGLNVSSGASLQIGNYANPAIISRWNALDCDIQGPITSVPITPNYGLEMAAMGTIRFSGTNGVWNVAAASHVQLQIDPQSTLELDNNTNNNNLTDRFADVDGLTLSGKLVYRGNSSASSTETIGSSTATYSGLYSLSAPATIQMIHGTNVPATLTFARVNSGNAPGAGWLLRITGDDIGATAQAGYSKVAMPSSASYWTNGVAKGGWITVGSEFAAYDATKGVYAYDRTGPNADTTLTTSTGTNKNVQLTAGLALTNVGTAYNAYTLKLNGTTSGSVALDLGGQTLAVGFGDQAGLIVTGSGASITNGLLSAGTLGTKYLSLQTDADLTISATIQAGGITKVGLGTLTLGGLCTSATVKLAEGGFTLNSPITVTSDVVWLGGGTLTVDGGGTFKYRAEGYFPSASPILVKSGTFVFTGATYSIGGNYMNPAASFTVQAGGNVTWDKGRDTMAGAIFMTKPFTLNGGKITWTDYGNNGNSSGLAGVIVIPDGQTGYMDLSPTTASAGAPSAFYYDSVLQGSGTLIVNCLTNASLRSSYLSLGSNGGFNKANDPASTFSGVIQMASGYAAWDGTSTKVPRDLKAIDLRPGTTLNVTAANAIYTGISGSGVVLANANATNTGNGTTLTLSATTAHTSFLSPGTPAAAGILTVMGAAGASTVDRLSFVTAAGGYPELRIDALSAGGVAGADYDQVLVLGGTAKGISNANLVLNIKPGLDLRGQTLTILTAPNDLTLGVPANPTGFHGVDTSSNPLIRTAVPTFGPGAITISGITYNSALTSAGGLVNLGTNLALNTSSTVSDAATLSNSGGFGSMLAATFALSGTNAELFSAALNTGTATLGMGEIATYNVSFLGSAAAGTYEATLTFTTDAQYGPQTSVYSLAATVVAASDIPGDINRDHIVDQADYTVWYNHYGQTPATWADGDVTGDNIVDQADYTVWYNHYGQTGGNVPEPMTLALLAIGGLGLLRRRK